MSYGLIVAVLILLFIVLPKARAIERENEELRLEKYRREHPYDGDEP